LSCFEIGPGSTIAVAAKAMVVKPWETSTDLISDGSISEGDPSVYELFLLLAAFSETSCTQLQGFVDWVESW
jgi:hypothetical protein